MVPVLRLDYLIDEVSAAIAAAGAEIGIEVTRHDQTALEEWIVDRFMARVDRINPRTILPLTPHRDLPALD